MAQSFLTHLHFVVAACSACLATLPCLLHSVTLYTQSQAAAIKAELHGSYCHVLCFPSLAYHSCCQGGKLYGRPVNSKSSLKSTSYSHLNAVTCEGINRQQSPGHEAKRSVPALSFLCQQTLVTNPATPSLIPDQWQYGGARECEGIRRGTQG